MTVLQSHQLPDYASESEIRWTIPDDDVMITLDRVTGLYVARYLVWSDESEDWTDGPALSPAESLKLACHYQLFHG